MAERRATAAASTMRMDAGEPVDVVVLDISRSGVRLLTGADLAIGQEISIGLAGAGVTRAYVAWRDEDQYGCAFERPITPEDTAAAFSNAPIAQLGRTYAPKEGDQESLHELYRQHRAWSLPWDAVAMCLLLVGAAIVLIRFFRP